VHERLGARGVLVVDAVVAPPGAGAAGSGAGDEDIVGMAHRVWGALRGAPAGGDSEAYRAHRARRHEERAARHARRARQQAERGERGAPHAGDMDELRDWLEGVGEDAADEARFRGGGRPPAQFDVTRVELRLPGGRVVDITAEIGGLHVEDLFDAASGGGGVGGGGEGGGGRRRPTPGGEGAVIDAHFTNKR
jgi:hypothetical protein